MLLKTRLDYLQIGRRYVRTHAKRVDPSQVDVDGSNLNVFVGSVSYMAQAVSRQLSEGMRSLTLDADDEDLDRVVEDRYELPRQGAGAAVAPLRFFRTSFAAGAGSIPIGTRIATLTGVEYVTTTVASFGVTQLDGVLADARAIQAGFAFQVGANALTRVSQPNLLFDPSVQVNNDEPAAGGTEREDGPAYRERARQFWRSARRGILSAIEFGALQAEGVASAHAEEVIGPDGNPARMVTLLVSDQSGTSNRVLAARVQSSLLEFRAGGIYVAVLSSVPQIVDVTLSLAFVADADTASLSSNVRLAVANFVNTLGAQAVLRRADLFSVLNRFRRSGLVVTDGSIIAPAGDLVPDLGRTIRTRLENVQVV